MVAVVNEQDVHHIGVFVHFQGLGSVPVVVFAKDSSTKQASPRSETVRDSRITD